MGRPRKSHGDTSYPPRGMRADRAAAYLDMSETSFLTLVREGELPQGASIRGMVIWDRFELDAALENWKSRRKGRPSDDIGVILGLPDHG